MRRWLPFGLILAAIFAATALGGCAGLQQFPDKSDGPDADALAKLDADYSAALDRMYGRPPKQDQSAAAAAAAADTAKALDPDAQKQIRNEFIETRLAVIDVHFQAFVRELSRDNANADLLVALAGIGAGGAGALVSGGTSQILSAVSGGLAGGKSAYDKAVLYDNALTALIAQMVATRQQVAARIFTRWSAGIEDYPLWLARQDIAGYEFAGSLPGAIVATADDAKGKAEAAEEILQIKLPALTEEAVAKDVIKGRKSLDQRVAELSPAHAKALVAQLEKDFPDLQPAVQALYPDAERADDKNGEIAKDTLGFLINETALTKANLEVWDQAFNGLQ